MPDTKVIVIGGSPGMAREAAVNAVENGGMWAHRAIGLTPFIPKAGLLASSDQDGHCRNTIHGAVSTPTQVGHDG